MTQVSLKKELAEDLINSKLRIIVEEIEKILQKWKYDSIELFLTDSKSGKIRNAEDDAIVIQNLLDDQEELHQIKNKW
ncbi:hypothetical protein DSAG12_02949 [Promethearchaeum syntrophicum]|uniref:Uncharacterized protein n=1 Tax=Promethearchaeum syntrophicum TaxID=2594042 RepID=A0A5B9DE13_9ARCH|nr:hypothetical protein [Candidatus Prometheoarchaeum syntrophicum]QEE17117.1 hypothetical protein DSAG12_02949 [Candidatus Prometheoarchaeum syntrophicum]